MQVLRCDDGELTARLRAPFVADGFRAADDPLVVVVTPGGAPPARESVAALPMIVLGDGHDPHSPPDHVDAVVEPGVASLDDVLASIAAHPIAATALAMLLRGADGRSVHDGLLAESSTYSVLQAGPEFARWRACTPVKQRPAEHEPAVLVERDGDSLTVTLNRPHVRNALSRAMRDAWLDALAIARGDHTITSVTVRGAGPSFCSGGDLDEFGTFDDPASAHLVRLATSIGRAIDELRDRVTVEVHGVCAGSGVELPAFAARVIAAPDTTFALPEIGLGLIPGAGGTVSLPRRVGRHRTALLALSGAVIDAATAHRWGLVDSVR